MATLFGGSALFYFFFFPPSPVPEMQEVKAAVPGAYDMENRHRGQLSLRLSCFLSCLDSDEEEWAQRELSLFLSLSFHSLSPFTKASIHYKCILYMCTYIKYINIHTLHSTHYPHVCIISVSSKHFKCIYLNTYICVYEIHIHTRLHKCIPRPSSPIARGTLKKNLKIHHLEQRERKSKAPVFNVLSIF